MTLLRHMGMHIRWQFAMLRVLYAEIPGAMVKGSLAIAGTQFARLLAFFIPLKILLLLGSDGIPRYFQFFIVDETRDFWIAGLSALVFVFYALSVLLYSISGRALTAGTNRLLSRQEANSESAADDRGTKGAKSRQGAAAKSRRRKLSKELNGFLNISADSMLFFVALVLFLLIDPLIVPYLVIASGAVLLLANYIIYDLSPSWLRVKRLVIETPKRFTAIAHALMFLGIFVYLLMIFLFFGGMNVLFAILIFILARRGLQSYEKLVTTSIGQIGRSAMINQTLLGVSDTRVATVDASYSPLNDEDDFDDDDESVQTERASDEAVDTRQRRRAGQS